MRTYYNEIDAYCVAWLRNLMAHGVPARVANLRALGNAIVPQAGAAFVQAYLACRP